MIKKIIFVLLIVNIINLFFFGIFDLLTGYPTLFRTLGDVLNIFCFLLFYATKKNVKLKFYGGKYMLIFVLITLISMIINKTELILLAIFFRRMLVYYLLYIMVSNINFTLSQFEKLKKLLIGIFILQIPVSIIKLVFVGITEQNIGTLSILEGSLTTVFTLFAISFSFAYLLYEKSPKYYLYILGFLLFALIGGKRAIIIYIPILIFTILFFYYKLNNKNIFADLNFYKTIIAITPAFLLIFYLTVVLIPDHNKEHKVGGSFDIKFVSEYAFGYVTNDAEGQYSLGRAVAPFIAYNTLSNRGYDKILFGLGPGHLIKSSLNKESNSEGEGNTLMFKLYGLGYGARIGMIWMGLQVGILGVFALFLFHLHLLKKTLQLSKISENINYKIIALGQIGCGLVFFIDFFTYSQTTLYIGSMQFIYFFTMGYLHNNNRFETELSLDNEK